MEVKQNLVSNHHGHPVHNNLFLLSLVTNVFVIATIYGRSDTKSAIATSKCVCRRWATSSSSPMSRSQNLATTLGSKGRNMPKVVRPNIQFASMLRPGEIPPSSPGEVVPNMISVVEVGQTEIKHTADCCYSRMKSMQLFGHACLWPSKGSTGESFWCGASNVMKLKKKWMHRNSAVECIKTMPFFVVRVHVMWKCGLYICSSSPCVSHPNLGKTSCLQMKTCGKQVR